MRLHGIPCRRHNKRKSLMFLLVYFSLIQRIWFMVSEKEKSFYPHDRRAPRRKGRLRPATSRPCSEQYFLRLSGSRVEDLRCARRWLDEGTLASVRDIMIKVLLFRFGYYHFISVTCT